MKMIKLIVLAVMSILPAIGFSKTKIVSLTLGDGTVIEAGDMMTFALEDMPDTVKGYEVLSEYLPDGISVEWTGKKFSVPKGGKVKYSKSEEDFVATSDENPSNFKISINKKKGTIKGSFKVYCQKSEKKLKSYTFSFSGTLGGTLNVKYKSSVVATASFE